MYRLQRMDLYGLVILTWCDTTSEQDHTEG